MDNILLWNDFIEMKYEMEHNSQTLSRRAIYH